MTKIMGIVNVTPDSFSDGGQFFRPEEALRRAHNLAEEGADIIDLGGESTRPGATPLGWEEEWRRLEPVLRGLVSSRGAGPSPTLSVDTYHPETAARALAAGATLINCVYADSVMEMARLCAQSGAELVLPYRLSGSFPTAAGTRDAGPYRLEEVSAILSGERLYLDPMIGFDTTREEDLALLKSVPELVKVGRVLIGASRKRLVKKLTGEKMLGKNLGGNLGLAVWAAMKGAAAVRVHDVKETFQAIKVVETLGV